MKNYNALPPLERLKEIFLVDPISPSGLRWKAPASRRVRVDGVAGSPGNRGYWRVKIGDRLYLSHRIVWAITNGVDPGDLQVDHIDGNPANNHPENLRLATNAQNGHNKANRRVNNTSGVAGVRWYRSSQKCQVQIIVHGKQLHLGYFTCKEEAIKVRREAELKYFGEFAPVRGE